MDLSKEANPLTKDFASETSKQTQVFGEGVKKIIKLDEKYDVSVFGLGEVYEMMSVERIRKKLLKKYGSGTLYLAPNKKHIQRGITLGEMKRALISSGSEFLAKGFADSPPWNSNPRGEDNKRNYSPFIVLIAKIIFFFLVRIEFLQAGPRHSHMIYCLVKGK
jgi:hypothetical protein